MTDRRSTPQSPNVEALPIRRPPASEEELRAIFLAHGSYVAHSLERLGVRTRDVEDLTHDVFLVVWRHLGDYDRARPIKPWLFGISVRVALGHKRRARHRLEVVDSAADAVDEQPPADEQLAAWQQRRVVLEALDAVDLDRRAVLVMHDLDEIPMPEIAATLGVPLNTGYSRLRLARQEFSAAVKRIQARRGGP